MCEKYDVHIEFVEDCKAIFTALSQIFIPSIYAQIIAEYAATQYIHCMECRDLFGFIECRQDYMMDCGATAVGDEDGAVRYYLDTEPLDLSECEEQNNYEQETEIMCIACAESKKCGVCGSITLSCTEIVDECLNCKVIICEMCSYSLTFEDDNGNSFTLCKQCEEDEAVNNERIQSLIRKRTASLSESRDKATNDEEKSTSNDWRKWDFGTFSF